MSQSRHRKDSKAKKAERHPIKKAVRSLRFDKRQKMAAKRVQDEPKQGHHIRGPQAAVRIVPLGGLREIGKNMSCIEYGDDIILIDCGIGFPQENMPGIDIVIPDFSYLKKRNGRIRGLFLTHGHEDHIGAVTWFMRSFQCPVYGTPLTMKLVANKLEDYGRGGSRKMRETDEGRLHVVSPGDCIQAGAMSVEFIHVNHSIADACALAVKTPVGTIVHSGDFKVDFTPVHGEPIDLPRFAALGQEGVLALMLESTNAEQAGMTPSEKSVGKSFSDLFEGVQGRIFVATFSSNVFRLQQIISAAEAHQRKVALLGYSMQKVFDAADALGYITYKKETMVDARRTQNIPDEHLLFITTGSQGEPMAALTRMAFSEHRSVNIKEGDTVLLSSSMIPGNEKSIYRVINELFKSGANVIYESLADIHVSGHAYREELRLMIDLVRPKYFIPVHGEYRHLYRNAELALGQKIPAENIFLLSNGEFLELNASEAEVTGFAEANDILVDGSGVGDVDEFVLRERRLLADDGVITICLVADRSAHKLVAPPEIQALGFIYADATPKLIDSCQKRIYSFIDQLERKRGQLARQLQNGQLKELLRNDLYRSTKRRPVVLLTVIEV